jgi:dTDP-4-dehydrorhamnose 3,5-epimerase
MEKIETGFPGLWLLQPRVFEDARGHFFESYNKKEMDFLNLSYDWVQDNQSYSVKGVIRGLHFQKNPFTQAKLIRVFEGNILDVVVDIRQGSPTYGKSYSVELSSENRSQLLIPHGFAHGFSVLSDGASVLYKCDNYYHGTHEEGIRLDDTELNIDWKVPLDKAIISDKDKVLQSFSSLPHYFTFKNA